MRTGAEFLIEIPQGYIAKIFNLHGRPVAVAVSPDADQPPLMCYLDAAPEPWWEPIPPPGALMEPPV